MLKWRRQYPITVADGDIERTFIADFYCVQKKLAIEIDGSVHATQREYDDARTAAIEALGIIVVRITNDDVLNDMQSVLERIMTIVG